MPTEDEDLKPKDDDPQAGLLEAEDAGGGSSSLALRGEAPLQAHDEPSDGEAATDEGVVVPTQLGSQRFVFAAYFAAGIAVAFLLSKVLTFAWQRLGTYKPQLGEPQAEIVMPLAAVIGGLTAVYYYRDQRTRTMAEEVASELGKVSWPSRDEVVNGTVVVIVTTLVATTFFALMDRFWGFVTNLVYGA